MVDALLRVENLSKSFGGVAALSDVSFSIERGQVLGVIGPNGAGKTTLINVISSVVGADSGRVEFDGTPIEGQKPHTIATLRIARTMQLAEHFGSFTVTDYVLLGRQEWLPRSAWASGLRWPGTTRRERQGRESVGQWLDRFGLLSLRDATIRELPYGARKLVDVARAAASEPKFLMLDEPTSGCSHAERNSLRQQIEVLGDEGITMMIVDHDVNFVSDTCDSLLAMSAGKQLAQGAPATVLANQVVIESYLGAAEPDAPRPL